MITIMEWEFVAVQLPSVSTAGASMAAADMKKVARCGDSWHDC